MDNERFLKPQQASHKIKYADSRPTQDHCPRYTHILFMENSVVRELTDHHAICITRIPACKYQLQTDTQAPDT